MQDYEQRQYGWGNDPQLAEFCKQKGIQPPPHWNPTNSSGEWAWCEKGKKGKWIWREDAQPPPMENKKKSWIRRLLRL